MKCATVAIIGRPSAGKSTLLNTICEMKVSITAATPQTTRNAIRGIYTDGRGQLIFTDTPGYHLSEQTLNKRLQDIARGSLNDSDAVLYLIDATRAPGQEEEAIAAMLATLKKTPVICCINKSDILSEAQIETARSFLVERLPSSPVLVASAKNDEGVDEILIELFKVAPEGDLLYGENAYTDQPIEFRISEIIREKAISIVTDEIPHAIYVEVADLEYREADNTVWVRAFIIVERETQKGIIVGRGGEGIKKIRIASFKEVKRLFPGRKVNLDLRVKAQPKWRTNSIVLDRILR